jgi:hypothetical protein
MELNPPSTCSTRDSEIRKAGERRSAWQENCERFLAAVSSSRRPQVADMLHHMHNGGSGLRYWIEAITWRGASLPDRIPDCIIDVYLSDSEAMPLYDCEQCGLAIPVRPSRLYGFDGDPEEVYFPNCPICGARTGLFLHFTRDFEERVTDSLRRRPR